MAEVSKLTWHKRTHGHAFTGAEFRVLMSIFDHSDERGRNSHPGLKLLMAETGYGKTAVSEALTALQARGWITQARRGSGTSGKTSVYELVPDAPSSTAGAVPPTAGSSTAGADQPTEVGPVERTSWSAGADTVVPLERTPTDPDNRSGSDHLGTDQVEVRHSPNHLEDLIETAPYGRSLSVGDQQEDAASASDPGRSPEEDSSLEAASTTAADTGWRPEGLQRSRANSHALSNPATESTDNVGAETRPTAGLDSDPWSVTRQPRAERPAPRGTFLTSLPDPWATTA